jgi:hypothetical protein
MQWETLSGLLAGPNRSDKPLELLGDDPIGSRVLQKVALLSHSQYLHGEYFSLTFIDKRMNYVDQYDKDD